MSTSWLQNIASSSPPALARSASAAVMTPTPMQQARKSTMFHTPAQHLLRNPRTVETPSNVQQERQLASPVPEASPHQSPLNVSSMDPSLEMPTQSHKDSQPRLEPPPSTQRHTLGSKQPRQHVFSDTGNRTHSGDESDEESSSSEDESVLAKRRRLAQSTGERLGLSTKSISDAKEFANMHLHDQNVLLFCMIALIRDNQNDATDAWTPSEDALDNIKAVVKATFLSPTLSEYKGDSVIAVILKILMERDLGLPDDCFSNPAKRATLIRIIKYWCTETRADYKKTIKYHTLGESPSDISELADALLSKTNPRLADSFELWARLAVLRGTLLRNDHERFWDKLNEEMVGIRKRARDRYPAETQGSERAQHIHKEFKKALSNDYKQFGEPSLVHEPPRRNTLRVSDFQADVDNATSSRPSMESTDAKKKRRKGKKIKKNQFVPQ